MTPIKIKVVRSHEYPKPYHVIKVFENGQELIWTAHIVRRAAMSKGQFEAKRFKCPIEVGELK